MSANAVRVSVTRQAVFNRACYSMRDCEATSLKLAALDRLSRSCRTASAFRQTTWSTTGDSATALVRTFRLDSCLGGRYTRFVNSRDEPALAACQVRQLSVMRAPSGDSVNEQPPYPAVEGRPTWAAKMGSTNAQLSTAVGVAQSARDPIPDA